MLERAEDRFDQWTAAKGPKDDENQNTQERKDDQADESVQIQNPGGASDPRPTEIAADVEMEMSPERLQESRLRNTDVRTPGSVQRRSPEDLMDRPDRGVDIRLPTPERAPATRRSGDGSDNNDVPKMRRLDPDAMSNGDGDDGSGSGIDVDGIDYKNFVED